MMSFLASHQHVLAYLRQAVGACVTLVLVVAIFAPLEHLFPIRRARLFYPGWTTNLGWYFVNALTVSFLLGPPLALIIWAVHGVLPAAVTTWGASLPLGERMIAAMVVGEVGFYWGHRWSHEIPFLWRFHAVHHSARHVGFLVNTRAHPVDLVFTRLCGFTLLFATGLAGAAGSKPDLVVAAVLFIG